MSETQMMRRLAGALGREMFLQGYDVAGRNVASLIETVLAEMRSPDLPTRKALGSAAVEVRWQDAIDAILEAPPLTPIPPRRAR